MLEPKILLLDEPFASLDQHLRERLREEVRDLQQRLGITTLFVTHGQDEALALADRIVVMRDGRTEQIAPPDVIYREPATPFVAGFIGTMNLIDGAVDRRRLPPRRPRAAGPGRRRPRDPRRPPRGARRSPRPRPAPAPASTASPTSAPTPSSTSTSPTARASSRWSPTPAPGAAGSRSTSTPRAFALYRDNAAIHRSG